MRSIPQVFWWMQTPFLQTGRKAGKPAQMGWNGYFAGERAQNGAVKRLQSYGNGAAAQNNRKTSQNQFHNFKQRDTDYDALMLQNVKEWMDSPE